MSGAINKGEKMTSVIIIIFIVIAIVILWQIKRICFRKGEKSYKLIAKKKEFSKIYGRPTRYKIDVIFELGDKTQKGTIITIDRNAESLAYKNNIPIWYFIDSGKIYWAEESNIERKILIGFLSIIEILLLLIIILEKI